MSITLWVLEKALDICTLSSVFKLCEYFKLFSYIYIYISHILVI